MMDWGANRRNEMAPNEIDRIDVMNQQETPKIAERKWINGQRKIKIRRNLQ